MNTQLQLGPSYYQAACFYANRGNQKKLMLFAMKGYRHY